jgi:hypothetical protein
MRSARVLLVLSVAAGMAYTTTVIANAAETTGREVTASPVRALPVAPGATRPAPPTVEVYAANGAIRRVPVKTSGKVRSRVEATTSSGAAATLSVPLAAAEVAAEADSTVTTLQNSGPAGKRFDLVFVGDGYRASEQQLFHQHAAAQWESIKKRQPFASLQASFNVWLVDVASQDSGADNETPGAQRNTSLGATFFCNNIERLLCANSTKAREYASKAPGADQVAIIVNTTKYGGAGGSVTTVAGGNASAAEILIHELGHSIGGLADEYTSPGVFSGGEPREPNVSKLDAAAMRSSGSKWATYLGQSAPDNGVIDAFEGAKYAEKGIYRPSKNSIMRTLGREFDPVGSAAVRNAILAKVS